MQKNYVQGIDSLRAFAVLAVMIFHLNAAFLPGGFAGVDIFFVISGYVVARSLQDRANESIGKFIAGFYSRRIRRIVPALLVCLIVTTLATALFIPDSWLSGTTKQTGIFAFFGLSNFALVYFQDDYFSPRTEYNPYTHTWSLGVEEQFYFIFPILFFAWLRINRKENKSRLDEFCIYLIPLLSITSLYYAYFLGNTKPDAAYYLIFSRFWELAAGVMLFQLQVSNNLPRLSVSLNKIIFYSGILLMCLGVWMADKNSFPYPWALLPVAGTLLALLAITCPHNTKSLPRALTSEKLLYIGKISYSLYLWHWPVYVLFRWTVGLESPLYMLAALSVTFILAMLSYHFIETPIRKAHFKANWQVLAFGLTCIFASSQLAEFFFKHREHLSLSVTADTYQWYPYAHSELLEQKNTLQGRQVFVIGNSHAEAYRTMLTMLENQHSIKTHVISTGHCAIGNMLYPVMSMHSCQASITEHLNYIKAHANRGDTVFFASLRMHRISDQWFSKDPQSILQYSLSTEVLAEVEQAFFETSDFIEALEPLGVNILIDLPKPVLPAPTYRCSDWFNQNNPICQRGLSVSQNLINEMRQPVVRSIKKLQSSHPQIYLWDPLPALCHENTCSAFDQTGQPIFFDGDHLSAHGNRVLYPEFEKNFLDLYALSSKEEKKIFLEKLTYVNLNEKIEFSEKSLGLQYLYSGWSRAEHWGTWSSAKLATLYLPTNKNKVQAINISMHPFLAPSLKRQHVDIFMNDQLIHKAELSAETELEITIPKSLNTTSNDSLLKIEFKLPDAESPAELGMSDDTRKLAIGMRSITLR